MTFFSVIFEGRALTSLAVCNLPCSANMMSITCLKPDFPPQNCPYYKTTQGVPKKGVSFDLYQDLNVYVCKNIWSFHINYASLFIFDKVQLNPGMEGWNFLWVLFMPDGLRSIRYKGWERSALPWLSIKTMTIVEGWELRYSCYVMICTDQRGTVKWNNDCSNFLVKSTKPIKSNVFQ